MSISSLSGAVGRCRPLPRGFLRLATATAGSASAGLRPSVFAVSVGSPRLEVPFGPRWSRLNHKRTFSSPVASLLAAASSPIGGDHSDGGENLGPSNPVVDFGDVGRAFQVKSSAELLMSYVILRVCGFEWVVKHSEKLIRAADRILGPRATEALIRHTFFRQFCAGESEKDIGDRLHFLRSCGVFGILDTAAEADLPEAAASAPAGSSSDSLGGFRYAYAQDTAPFDRQVNVFLGSIRACRDSAPEGFTAVKLTGLCDPMLLQRVSTALVEMRSLFSGFETNEDGFVDVAGFRRGVSGSLGLPEAEADRWFSALDLDQDGLVDYVDWLAHLRPEHAAELSQFAGPEHALSRARLSAEETGYLDALRARLVTLCEAAEKDGVRLMIDAEHSYFLAANDFLIVDMQRRFNRLSPLVFGTYQCYLRDSQKRLRDDFARAKREGWILAAKLVRGAYMVLERQHAAQTPGAVDPVWPTLGDTHANYDSCVEFMLESRLPVVVASHNQRSIELALEKMRQLGIPRIPADAAPGHGTVSFGQLLGMADHLTFTLGQAGYQAFKYVPYGPIREVIPYLIRRAQENSGLLSGGAHERKLLVRELLRRVGLGRR